MSNLEFITGRKSIRKFKDDKVEHSTIVEIMEATRFSPSWANFQVARYTFIDNLDLIAKIKTDGVNNFAYNVSTLENAKNVLVLSYVTGRSGKFPHEPDYVTKAGSDWEVFDTGIACQTFCLAAHAKGIGTCIMGVIDPENIAEIADLPENEKVAAVIVYGYPDEDPEQTTRKSVEQITRFLS